MVRAANALAGYSDRDWGERNLMEGLTAAVQACAKYIQEQQVNVSPALNRIRNDAGLSYISDDPCGDSTPRPTGTLRCVSASLIG